MEFNSGFKGLTALLRYTYIACLVTLLLPNFELSYSAQLDDRLSLVSLNGIQLGDRGRKFNQPRTQQKKREISLLICQLVILYPEAPCYLGDARGWVL